MDKFNINEAVEKIGLSEMQKFCARKFYSADKTNTLEGWQRQLVKDGIADFEFPKVEPKVEEKKAEVK